MMTTSLAALAATLTLSTALADGHTASEQDVETVLEAYSGALSQEDVAGSEMPVATFDIRMEYTVRGEARERDAHGTAILEMTPDGWRIRHLHTS